MKRAIWTPILARAAGRGTKVWHADPHSAIQTGPAPVQAILTRRLRHGAARFAECTIRAASGRSVAEIQLASHRRGHRTHRPLHAPPLANAAIPLHCAARAELGRPL